MISNFSYSYIPSKHTEGHSLQNRKLTLPQHSEATSTDTKLRDCASSRDGPRHTGKFMVSIPFPRQTRSQKRSRKLKN